MKTQTMDAPHQETPIEVRVGGRELSAEYKQRINSAAAACKRGEVGMILRRKGLRASTLVAWRKQQRAAGDKFLAPQKRRQKALSSKAQQARLQCEPIRVEAKLHPAEAIIDMQKPLCMMLGLPVADEAP